MQQPNDSTKGDNQLTAFEGEILHQSLDVKDGILSVGFRYRKKVNEEATFILIAHDGVFQIIEEDSIDIKSKTYWFEKQERKLARIEDQWSLNALRQFLSDQNNPHSSKEVFENVNTLMRRYIELDQDIDYLLLTAWAIGTYFHPIFSAYPFLHIKAPKRSGKSQCLNLLSQVCFNAIKARPTLPALSDTVDSLRGTCLIDQAESLGSKGTEDLLNTLTDSYTKNGGKRRIVNFDKKRGREILEFETYSPKSFASTRDLPEDLRDRCFVIGLIRSQRNFLDPVDNENWREIRGSLYKMLMTKYEDVSATYMVRKIEHKHKGDIVGRSLDLWLPFEIILECCGMHEKIEEAKKRFLSQYRFSEYEPTEFEEAVVQKVYELLRDEPEIVKSPKEICEMLNIELFELSDPPKQRASKVGWAIKKFNLCSDKKPRSKEGMKYVFKREKVENIYSSYFKQDDSHTSHTPSVSDNQNLNAIPPF